jgi:hypothetical protein
MSTSTTNVPAALPPPTNPSPSIFRTRTSQEPLHVRLACVLLNYLQGDFSPIGSVTVGLFNKHSKHSPKYTLLLREILEDNFKHWPVEGWQLEDAPMSQIDKIEVMITTSAKTWSQYEGRDHYHIEAHATCGDEAGEAVSYEGSDVSYIHAGVELDMYDLPYVPTASNTEHGDEMGWSKILRGLRRASMVLFNCHGEERGETGAGEYFARVGPMDGKNCYSLDEVGGLRCFVDAFLLFLQNKRKGTCKQTEIKGAEAKDHHVMPDPQFFRSGLFFRENIQPCTKNSRSLKLD